MLRLKLRQRVALGDTLRALANLAAAAFVFSQFVAQRSPSLKLIIVGVSMWLVLISFGLLLIGDD